MKKLVLLPIIICICLLGNSLLASTDTLSEPERIALQAKSDSLFAEGVDLYKAKKYQDAIPLFTEADRIDKAILDSTSNRRDYSAMWLASCLYYLGDTDQATETLPEYYRFAPIDRRLTIESDSLSSIGKSYYKQGKFNLALSYFKRTASIEKNVIGDNHILYANSLVSIVSCYNALSDTINTINCHQQYANIILENYGEYSDKYLKVLDEHVNTLVEFGYYHEALPQLEKAFSIADSIGLDTQKELFAFGISWLGVQIGQSLSGDDEREYYRKSLDYLEYCSEDTTIIKFRRIIESNIAVSYSKEAIKNYQQAKYAEAITLATNALEIYERSLDKEDRNYATLLSNLAACNSKIRKYAEAISLGTKALEIRERVLGKESEDYVTSLNNLATYNSHLGNYTEAVRLGMEALIIGERVFDKKHNAYVSLLNNLALYNSSLENYTEAIRLKVEALEIVERILGKNHEDYATLLSDLAEYKSNIENYDEAISFEMTALKIYERVLGKENEDYARTLNNLATYNSHLGNYTEAVRLGTEALEIRERVLGKESEDYVTSLNNLASYNSSLGKYAEAISLGTKALEIRERVLGKENEDYARTLNNLATYNSHLGNYTEAVRLGVEALKIYERVLSIKHKDYATSLSNLAYYNSLIGNYNEAIKLETEALKIREHVLGKVHSSYAISLSHLAVYNSYLGNYIESVKFETEALVISWKIFGRDHSYYATSLSNLAVYNLRMGDYNEAIILATEALKISERIQGKCHPDYATLLNILANINSDIGNYTEAIKFETGALKINELLEKNHPHSILAKENLGRYCFYAKDLAVDRYAREATEGNMAFIRKMFGGMTGYERANFWGMKESWFNHWLPNFAYGMGTDTLVECAVNGALMSKGLLLNSEIEMTRLLQESGDEAALEKYQELRLNRLQLNKLYEKPIAERPLDADSLETVVDRLERELVAMSKAYGDYTRNLVIDWRQVQAKLGERDAAVEFVRFALMESDSVMYAAYVTRPGYAVPRMIPLFEARQLEALADFEYEDERLSELVWKPLAEVLTGVERVYFAPAGELYNMAIESAPDWEDPERLMSDRRELYRLSSTRELAVTYDDSTASSASVYGGIDYDRVERGKSKDERGRDGGEMLLSGKRAWLTDSLGLRAGVEPLLGTRVEAESVDRSLRGRRVASELLTDSLGSEMSIKALSGLRKGLLHIATHGFYYSEEEIQKMGSHNFLRLEGMQGARYVEDKALTRSGLLMAGANSALKGEAPEGENDGILTAKEISQLDLRGMDLVVLSACQTGLGEVTGDGVFGLQRGFKKAGARSLLMSLWKVDDKATQLLMERFYDNLTAGMSKHEALLNAQRYVREYEVPIDTKSGRRETTNGRRMALPVGLKMHPYSNPKYWAGFVLLDGE